MILPRVELRRTEPEGMVCPYCERPCPRCGYDIPGGWEHHEQVQAPESNVIVCNLVQFVRPLVEVLSLYFAHKNDHHHVRPV